MAFRKPIDRPLRQRCRMWLPSRCAFPTSASASAKRLGIEKVAVPKQDNMYLYLVGDDNRAYYAS